jgi:DNA polymerase
MINAMGYARDDVFIANICKCRPPGNRTPLPDEMRTCLPYLREQIRLIRPKVIVLVLRPHV